MNRRPFLIGILAGIALATASVGGATLLSKKQTDQFLRVIDDNPHSIQGPNNEREFGPLSVRLIRNCKIEKFVTDSPQPDYTGSSFVKIDGMPKAQLNCLIGEARTNSLSIAIVDGIDTTPAECIGGWPTRFQNEAIGGFGLCRGQKNPNPVFLPTSPPKH
ncbi:hypothetical protein [Sphingopyxis fribergensis]